MTSGDVGCKSGKYGQLVRHTWITTDDVQRHLSRGLRREAKREKIACLLTQGHDIPADSDPLAALATAAPRRMMPAMADLLLRRAPAAPGEVYNVLSGSRIVGRILLSDASAASQWVWTLSYDYHEDRTPTHGYAATRDAALHAFARSWNRET